MIIFLNVSGGGANFYIGPLIMFVLPYLLSGGFYELRAAIYRLLSSAFGSLGSWWSVALVCIATAGLLVGLFTQVSASRVLRLVGQALIQGVSGGSGGAAAAAGRHSQQQRQQAAQQRQQKWDRVVHALHELPTDVIETCDQLEHLSSAQLKSRLQQQRIDCSSCLEKSDLISQLLQAGGSSGSSCSICCEDYAAGDVVRVLPCKHRYHIECVDKWFLSSTDYSREPACPMCNASLLPAGGS